MFFMPIFRLYRCRKYKIPFNVEKKEWEYLKKIKTTESNEIKKGIKLYEILYTYLNKGDKKSISEFEKANSSVFLISAAGFIAFWEKYYMVFVIVILLIVVFFFIYYVWYKKE